jgi:glucan phosphoethanolaminetransferase (alkaline phosphatase superfamily)
MLHDERILKNKFAYFFAIIFVLCWMIFFAYNMFKIFLRGYGLAEEYTAFKIPIYALYFLILPLLTVTFVSIFKESRKMFFYLNISLFLMIIFHAIIFYVKYQRTASPATYLFLYVFSNLLFVVGPVVLINYFKHIPAKNEIENIGKHND